MVPVIVPRSVWAIAGIEMPRDSAIKIVPATEQKRLSVLRGTFITCPPQFINGISLFAAGRAKAERRLRKAYHFLESVKSAMAIISENVEMFRFPKMS